MTSPSSDTPARISAGLALHTARRDVLDRQQEYLIEPAAGPAHLVFRGMFSALFSGSCRAAGFPA
jgi:hypothetical protein